MSAQRLKEALRDHVLGAIEGLGAVDLERMDLDDLLLRVKPPDPYWTLSLAGITDAEAQFGRGLTEHPLLRVYNLRLEGAWGIRGTEYRTADWERLVETVIDRLHVGQAKPAELGAVKGMRFLGLRAAEIDVLTRERTRYHHARIEADYQAYYLAQ